MCSIHWPYEPRSSLTNEPPDGDESVFAAAAAIPVIARDDAAKFPEGLQDFSELLFHCPVWQLFLFNSCVAGDELSAPSALAQLEARVLWVIEIPPPLPIAEAGCSCVIRAWQL